MALAGTLQLRSQGPMFVHAHPTEGVTGFEEREEANGVGGGNGDVNGDGDGGGVGTGTGMEASERTQDGNRDGSGDGDESSSRDGNGNEDGIGEVRGEAKKRKKPYRSCRRDVENRGDLGGKRTT